MGKFEPWGLTLLSTLVLLIAYLFTMPPSLTWAHWGADGGDLAVAVAKARLPHPPGFPTYLLFGAIFLQFPWGDPAWRLNLLSAFSGALAGGLTAAAIRHASCSAFIAIIAGLSLGFAPLFWSQAIIAEVYALAALFSAALLFTVLRPVPTWLQGILWGLGIGVHPTLIFLAPLIAGKNKSTLCLVSFALLTVGLLYGPVLLAWGRAPSPWADLSTPLGWWAYVSGRLYQGYPFGLPLTFWPRRLLALAGLMVRQFTPFGALLALWGWVCLWRNRRSLAFNSAMAFSAFSLWSIGYNTTDSLVYLVPALPLTILWMGEGLKALAGRLRKAHDPFPWLLMIIPLLQILSSWGKISLRGDRSAIEWAESILRKAPPAAVLITSSDPHTFTLWYVQEILGKRPDLVVIDKDLWWHKPYREMILKELGMGEEETQFDELLNLLQRPVLEVK